MLQAIYVYKKSIFSAITRKGCTESIDRECDPQEETKCESIMQQNNIGGIVFDHPRQLSNLKRRRLHFPS